MKKMFIAMLIALLGTAMSAQEATVTWGPDNSEKTFVNRILGEIDGEIFLLSSLKDKFFIEVCKSSDLSKVSSGELKLPEIEGKKSEIEYIFFHEGKILLFVSIYTDKTNNIYAYSVDKNGVLSRSSVNIFNIEVENKQRSGDFSFVVSEDNTKILVYHDAVLKKEKVQKVSVKVIDLDLNVKADLVEKFPLKEEKTKYRVSDYTLDNQEKIFMLLQMATKEKNVIVFDYIVLSYDTKNNNAKTSYNIDLDKDHRIAEMAFAVNESKGVLSTCGYYIKRSTKGLYKTDGIEGIFLMNIDINSKSVLSQKLTAFSKTDIAQFIGEKAAAKGKQIPNLYYPREFLIKDDGGMVLVSEMYQVMEVQTGGPVGLKMIHNMFLDIMVVNINPDGSIKWTKKVPKSQDFIRKIMTVSVGAAAGGVYGSLTFGIQLQQDKTVYLSYLLGVKDDKIHLVYNVNPKEIPILSQNKPVPLINVEKGIPILVTLTEEGTMTREILPGGKDVEVNLRPRINNQIDQNNIIIYGTRKSIDKIGRIILN